MDLSRLQQFAMEQMMAVRPPQSQALPGMLGNATSGAMASMNGRLAVGTPAVGGMNPTGARMAVLPGSSAGAAVSASYSKGPATKKQKL